jgi:hypothetical protein
MMATALNKKLIEIMKNVMLIINRAILFDLVE